MKTIADGLLNVACRDVGPPDGAPIVLLHGFPYDVHAYDDAVDRLVAVGRRCVVPFLRGYGATSFRSADTPRSGQQAALGADLLALMDALAIPKAVLAGYDWGGRAACIVAALWPERVEGLVSCGAGYNIQDIAKAAGPAPPAEEHRLWYQYYLHADRGRAGLTENRRAFCAYLWRLWSPTWRFDAATFDRSAAAYDNKDFVEVVLHSYRHRFGIVPGDPGLDGIEQRLADRPRIGVRSIVLQGADDGVDPPAARDSDAPHFAAAYDRRVLPGIGHNLPQEAPGPFVDAILALGL